MTPLSSGVLRRLYLNICIGAVLFITVLQVANFKQFSLQSAERFHRIAGSWSVPFPRQQPFTPRFNSYGSTQCVPPISPELSKRSFEKHATCAKYSPFSAPRHRWATVTAFFGDLEANEHYTKALTTHLEHALVHGSEVHVLCDKMVDGLWNKPAFILDILLKEMLKPESKRLEWLVWVDGDSLILDQCRPATSFLPSTLLSNPLSEWQRRDEITSGEETPSPAINLVATHDPNGLNNGIFLLRVSQWAISLFTAILAYRHYNPDVGLRFSDQSAMELLLAEDEFKDQVQYVPQHWFNAFPKGEPQDFLLRNETELEALEDMQVRKGDWLVHMAGHHHKDQALNGWYDLLEGMEDVWESGDLQRDLDGEVRRWWEEKGYLW